MEHGHPGPSIIRPLRAPPAWGATRWRVAEPLTTIFGREADVVAVTDLLDANAARLVTITGLGGVGKTRLAYEVAVRMQDDFADGACFVPLASVRDPRQIEAAVIRSLGLQPTGRDSLDGYVADNLRDRHLLLVLDNLEPLARAAPPWIASLLGRCPRVSVLATSRVALNLTGEHRYILEPLALPVPDTKDDVDVVRTNPAAQLFVERGRAVGPVFGETPEHAAAVIEICRLLDGLPLALELAAAQLRLLPPRRIADRLEGRILDLHSDLVDVPPRHRTLGTAIAWSHDLLTPESQVLFRWLSVFVGGFSLGAVEPVAAAAGITDVTGPLLELVEHGLVWRREAGPDGYRFGMLEVVREFALTELEARADTERATEAMVRFILDLGRQAHMELYGPSQVVWLDRLEAERDNLQAIFAWLLGQGRVAEAAEFAANTIPFRGIRGYSNQDLPFLEELLAHPGLARKDVSRAHALLAVAIAQRATTPSVGGGVDAIDEALPIYRRAGLRVRVALALQHELIELVGMGEYERAKRAAEECIQLGRELDLPAVEIVGVMYLGALAWLDGRVEGLRSFMSQARSIPREKWPPSLLAMDLHREGQMHHSLGDYDAAERCIRESLALDRKIGSKASLASAYEMLGRIAHLREDFDVARQYYDQGMQAAHDVGNTGQANEIAGFVAELEKDMGHLDAAIRDMHDYVAEAEFERYPHGLGSSLDQYTELATHAGDLAQAARFMGAADAAYEGNGIRRWPGLSTERRVERETRLRKELGNTRFARAHAGGNALSAEAAIAAMLAWQPPPDDTATSETPPEPPAGLTTREMEVLQLMADGLTNQEIADALFVSHRTATSHTSSIIGKLGVPTRTAAVAYAIRNGLA